MLQLQEVNHLRDKKAIILECSSKSATWLVSDLNSKMQIQTQFLLRDSLVEENLVLRANDLWQKLLLRLLPSHRFISADFTQTLVSQWLSESDFSWIHYPNSAQDLLKYCSHLLPILADTNSKEIMEEWLGAHSDCVLRWGHWYHLSRWLWEKLNKNYSIPQPWLSGWLSTIESEKIVWSNKIYVDLGSELSVVEVEILWRLSQNTDVVVLMPGPQWQECFPQSLKSYSLLKEKSRAKKIGLSKIDSVKIVSAVSAKQTEDDKSEGQKTCGVKNQIQCAKFSSMLAEVKDAVAQTRKWLDSGVSPEEILLLAPQIEEYWPVLSAYLETEGIPVAKERVVTLQSFPDVLVWLAQLRMEVGLGHSVDLELSAYSLKNKNYLLSHFSFSEFKRLFTHFYEMEDLSRDQKIAHLYQQDFKQNESLTVGEFVSWSCRRWPSSENIDYLEQLLKQVFQDSPLSMKLNLSQWVSYIEKLCARMEVRVKDKDPGGIQVFSLGSGEWVEATRLWVMGLTEEAMKDFDSTQILLKDVLSLEKDTGYCLNYPDRCKGDLEVEWILDRDWKEIVLSTSVANFSGSVQMPALLWLKKAVELEQDWKSYRIPQETRWDQIQNSSLQKSNKYVQMDLGLVSFSHWRVPEDFSLSVSQVENYFSCPFKVAASKILRLSEQDDVDLEVDSMVRGQMIHAIFEKLTEPQPFRFDYSDEELMKIIDQAKKKCRMMIADERLWPALRRPFIHLAKRFLLAEKKWRDQFPLTQTVGRELEIRGVFSLEKNQFLSISEASAPTILSDYKNDVQQINLNTGQVSPNTHRQILFRGKIDRVDSDHQGHFSVIDYKSTRGELRHHGSWIKNQQLQLALYSHWLEMGFSSLGRGEVVSSVYFIARDLSRHMGMVKAGGVPEFISDSNNYSRIHESEKQELFSEACQLTGQAVKKMLAGEFFPIPQDGVVTCATCQWRKLCRAPHLN